MDRKGLITSSVAVFFVPDEQHPFTRSTQESGPIFDKDPGGMRRNDVNSVKRTVNVNNLLEIASGKFLMIGKGQNRKSMAFRGMLSRSATIVHLFNYIDKPDLTMTSGGVFKRTDSGADLARLFASDLITCIFTRRKTGNQLCQGQTHCRRRMQPSSKRHTSRVDRTLNYSLSRNAPKMTKSSTNVGLISDRRTSRSPGRSGGHLAQLVGKMACGKPTKHQSERHWEGFLCVASH